MKLLKMNIKEIETGKEYSVELKYDIVEKYILELFTVTKTDISKIPQLDEHEIFSGEDLDKFLMQLGIYSKRKEILPVIEAIYDKFPKREKNIYEFRLKFIKWD
jgi:hypothetical protein